MLRFRRDALFVGVEKRRVTLVRITRGRRPVLIAAESFPAPDQENTSFALQVLERELKSDRWQDTQLHVVLADSIVRYFVTPVPLGVRNIGELRETTQLRFEEIFGEETRDWVIVGDLAPGATHNLGCAVRKESVEGIRRISDAVNISLRSIAPFGVSEFNRHRKSIGYRSGWFVVFGSDTLWTAFKTSTGWLSTQNHPRGNDSLADLPKILLREQLRAGIDEQQVKYYWLAGDVPEVASTIKLNDKDGLLLGTPIWSGQIDPWSQSYRLALSPIWPACA